MIIIIYLCQLLIVMMIHNWCFIQIHVRRVLHLSSLTFFFLFCYLSDCANKPLFPSFIFHIQYIFHTPAYCRNQVSFSLQQFLPYPHIAFLVPLAMDMLCSRVLHNITYLLIYIYSVFFRLGGFIIVDFKSPRKKYNIDTVKRNVQIANRMCSLIYIE
jgi:hypothetical protein